jgi:hypothetical protein
VVFGGPGNDRFFFAAWGFGPEPVGPDVVSAGRGNDRIRIGNPNHTTVDCGPGEDVLTLTNGSEPVVSAAAR